MRKTINLIKKLWAVRFLRFLLVGGINTLFGYGVFAFFIFLGLHYALATILATICGVFFNFKTTGIIVFKNRDNRLIFRFFGIYLFGYLLNVGALKLFDIAGIKILVAQAILVLPLSFISFLLMRKLVFKTLKQSNKPVRG